MEQRWSRDAKCRSLSPQEADVIFYPGSGGRPTKAKAYCETCPVLRMCLSDAIQNKLQGFVAGTTEDERSKMAVWMDIKPTPIDNDVILFDKRKKQEELPTIESAAIDTVAYLYSISDPFFV